MPSDFKADDHGPVEVVSQRLRLFGCPARIIAELDLGNGATAHVPIGEGCFVSEPGPGYAELRLPFRGKMLEPVAEAVDEYECRTGRSIR
jgi:hypothetical protein